MTNNEVAPLQSNVTVASNVYLRDTSLSPFRDERFVRHVRGTSTIRELLSLVNPTYRLGPVRDLPESLLQMLTDRQRMELRGIRCPICGRMDYGALKDDTGAVRWGYLHDIGRQCRCRRNSTRSDERRGEIGT